MGMLSGVKFRCWLTEEQTSILNQWIGHQRFIYNQKVAEERYFYAFRKNSLALTGYRLPIDQQYAQFKDKELTPFLYEVPSQILRNGAYRYMQARQRFIKGLARRPVTKKKHGRQTVMITNELFRFVACAGGYELELGTSAAPIGRLKFKAHRPYQIPNVITISRHNGEWHVSFSYDTGKEEPVNEESLLQYFGSLNQDQLEEITRGADRGVAIPLADSAGVRHDFTETERKHLDQTEKRRRRYQKKYARQQDGSRRRHNTKKKIDKCYAKERNIRNDRAHKISHALVESDDQVFVFEDLNIAGMTRTAKPKQDENGNYVRNGAAAKSGLNKAILISMWGRVVQYTKYKGLRKNKLTVRIPAAGTSQECSHCGHTHPDNRATQALFLCMNCGLTMNADDNAALVIKKRGIAALLAGEIKVKVKKSVRFRKASAGLEQPASALPGDCSSPEGFAEVAVISTIQEATVNRHVGGSLHAVGA